MSAADHVQQQLFSHLGRPSTRSAPEDPSPPASPRGQTLRAGAKGPVQLPMFMPAKQLLGSLTATADRSYDDPDDVMAGKLVRSKRAPGEGHGAGVHASVSKEGVLNPVQMIHSTGGGLMMGQGHHRVAAAAEVSRRRQRDVLVPVVHTDAREGSDLPLNISSEEDEKRAVIADYRRWSEHTPAIGQDLGWKHNEERAAEKVKAKTMAKVNARPKPKRTGATGEM